MPQTLKIRGGTTAQNDAFIGDIREITIDTTKNTIRVHDGVTVGGYELALASLSNTTTDLTNFALADLSNTQLSNTNNVLTTVSAKSVDVPIWEDPETPVIASSAVSIDFASGLLFDVDLTSSITSVSLSNPQDGQLAEIRFWQLSAGTNSVTGWASGSTAGGIKWNGGTPPTIQPASNGAYVVQLRYNGAKDRYIGSGESVE